MYRGQTYLTASHSSGVIFAYIISRRYGENNGFLAGVSFPPSSSAPALAFLSRLKLPFPSLSNACHAGYLSNNRAAQVISGASRDLFFMSFTIGVNRKVSQGSSIF